MIFNLFRRRRNKPAVDAVYGAIVAQARQPYFYAQLPVPDTVSGRFDMIALHAIVVFHRFSGEDKATRAFGQQVFDLFFKDVDESLRELGVGDVSVPKKIKKLAQVFYGSADAYGRALKSGDRAALAEALGRNLFADADLNDQDRTVAARALAQYIEAAAADLATQNADTITAGTLSWIDPAAIDHLENGSVE